MVIREPKWEKQDYCLFEIKTNLTVASVGGSIARSTWHGIVYQLFAGYPTVNGFTADAGGKECCIAADGEIYIAVAIKSSAPSAQSSID